MGRRRPVGRGAARAGCVRGRGIKLGASAPWAGRESWCLRGTGVSCVNETLLPTRRRFGGIHYRHFRGVAGRARRFARLENGGVRAGNCLVLRLRLRGSGLIAAISEAIPQQRNRNRPNHDGQADRLGSLRWRDMRARIIFVPRLIDRPVTRATAGSLPRLPRSCGDCWRIFRRRCLGAIRRVAHCRRKFPAAPAARSHSESCSFAYLSTDATIFATHER